MFKSKAATLTLRAWALLVYLNIKVVENLVEQIVGVLSALFLWQNKLTI